MSKVALVAFNITEDVCEQSGLNYIPRASGLPQKMKDVLSAHTAPDVVIDVVPYKFKSGSKYQWVPAGSKYISCKQMNRNSLLDIENSFNLSNAEEKDTHTINASQIDFFLNPSEYKIIVSGFDLNGVFCSAVKELESLGYDTYVASDISRLYGKVTGGFMSSRKSKFCSYASAISGNRRFYKPSFKRGNKDVKH